jgi:pimeloyl-ACP methyl ester carboxylesterase
MSRYPPPGRMIDIGGRRLHLYETGQGSPTVVLEAGIAATSLNWRPVQSEIAKFARVASYDRVGLGWSDAANTPLTLTRLVDDLHSLLDGAQLRPPYILVAHSFGGLIVRAFAHRYPEQVTGIVLVDALRPEEWHPLSADQRRKLARGILLSRRGAALARMGVVGWCLRSVLAGSRWLPKAVGGAAGGAGLTVMKRLAGEIGKMPRELWPMVAEHWSQPKSFLGMAAYFEALPECAREVFESPPLEEVPVIIMTPAGASPLTSVGRNVRHVVAEKSGHWIHLDQPELVLEAVRALAAQTQPNRV